MFHTQEETDFVWKNIFPKEGEKSLSYITACPDCCDLDCGAYMVEIENLGTRIYWDKPGLDMTQHWKGIERGTSVEWNPTFIPTEFDTSEYMEMIRKFWNFYQRDEQMYFKRNPITERILVPPLEEVLGF